MVIVEPRQHAHLGYVLRNFDQHMPQRYDLYVFHGQSAAEYARQAAAGIERHRAVHFIPLPADDLSADEYNALLKSPAEFWDKVGRRAQAGQLSMATMTGPSAPPSWSCRLYSQSDCKATGPGQVLLGCILAACSAGLIERVSS